MTGLEILQMLWEAGKTAYEIATGLKKKKQEDRERLSGLFEHIGKLLHETYCGLIMGNYPHGHCAQIARFGGSIKSDFKKQLGEVEAEKLGNMLIVAYEVERLAGELSLGAVSKNDLIKLEESSGEFLAASQLIKF